MTDQSSSYRSSIGRRRWWLGWIVPACLVIFAPEAGTCAGDEALKRRPNILFLLTDDQRPDTVAALGNRQIATPNLDRLVGRGTSFTRAISPYPLCVPSRAEMLTGCSGFRNGVFPPLSARLDEGLTTLPAALRQSGYHTWFVGKWHIAGRPTARGYEQSRGLFAAGMDSAPKQRDALGREITGYHGFVFQDDQGRKFPERGIGLTGNISAAFADAAIALLETRPMGPFFLHVNFTAPHDPLIVPPGYAGKYRPADLSLPPNYLPQHPFDHGNFHGRDEQLWPWPRTKENVLVELAMYYAVISHLDEQVGRILEALDRTGQAENTIIVFASDHGLAIGSHGLRGKQNMYEHTINVPLILAGPGIPRGQRRAAQVYLRELYPTLCELAGVEVPDTVEGHGFAAVVRGETPSIRDHAFGYFADSQRMIRGDRWKLIYYPQIERYQLFDLAQDPFELKDLSTDVAQTSRIESLRKMLEAWQDRVGDPIRKKRS